MEDLVCVGLVLIGTALVAAACFFGYLLFLRFVIIRTGSTDGLSDVAKAISAYKIPLPSRQSRRPGE
jgi:hypothetical protein